MVKNKTGKYRDEKEVKIKILEAFYVMEKFAAHRHKEAEDEQKRKSLTIVKK